MNKLNFGNNNNGQIAKRTERFIIKNAPSSNIKKSSVGPSLTSLKDLPINKFMTKQQSFNEPALQFQDTNIYPLDKIKRTITKEESELKNINIRSEYKREGLSSKPDLNMDDYVKKSKFDELRQNFELLSKKYDDLKSKAKAVETNSNSVIRKNERLTEENRTLKEKIRELEAKAQRSDVRRNQVNHDQEENNVEEEKFNADEFRSLQLAMRLEAENILMNQLSQIATLQMLCGRPTRNVEVSDPNNINPDNMTYEELLQLEERIGKVSRGLDPKDIKKIPRRVVDKPSDTEAPCSICFCEVEVGTKVRKLPCSHEYHSKCIKRWLLNEKTCPICKNEVTVSE